MRKRAGLNQVRGLGLDQIPDPVIERLGFFRKAEKFSSIFAIKIVFIELKVILFKRSIILFK